MPEHGIRITMGSGSIEDKNVNTELVKRITADLLKAKNDIDIMRVLCCGYYATYITFSPEYRAMLDECAKDIRATAIKRAEERQKDIDSGYIIKED